MRDVVLGVFTGLYLINQSIYVTCGFFLLPGLHPPIPRAVRVRLCLLWKITKYPTLILNLMTFVIAPKSLLSFCATAVGILGWYVYRNAGDDDDLWKRLLHAARGRVTRKFNRLVVVPGPA